MGRKHRIRVYGKQRNNIDPAALAQVLILLGRHRHQQHLRRLGKDVKRSRSGRA